MAGAPHRPWAAAAGHPGLLHEAPYLPPLTPPLPHASCSTRARPSENAVNQPPKHPSQTLPRPGQPLQLAVWIMYAQLHLSNDSAALGRDAGNKGADGVAPRVGRRECGERLRRGRVGWTGHPLTRLRRRPRNASGSARHASEPLPWHPRKRLKMRVSGESRLGARSAVGPQCPRPSSAPVRDRRALCVLVSGSAAICGGRRPPDHLSCVWSLGVRSRRSTPRPPSSCASRHCSGIAYERHRDSGRRSSGARCGSAAGRRGDRPVRRRPGSWGALRHHDELGGHIGSSSQPGPLSSHMPVPAAPPTHPTPPPPTRPKNAGSPSARRAWPTPRPTAASSSLLRGPPAAAATPAAHSCVPLSS
jgi:hypothetical protein